MTHIKNIPHILEHGITHASSTNANQQYYSIGDSNLINYRKQKNVLVDNTNVKLGDCIPFYFGVRMPMLYVMKYGGNGVSSAINQQEIIYVVVSIKYIYEDKNISCFFSDGHAVDFFTKFYIKDDISRLTEILDDVAIRADKWAGEDVDIDLKRRKQAEFLVLNDIPSNYIVGYICYNNDAKTQLLSMNIDDNKIKICPTAYY